MLNIRRKKISLVGENMGNCEGRRWSDARWRRRGAGDLWQGIVREPSYLVTWPVERRNRPACRRRKRRGLGTAPNNPARKRGREDRGEEDRAERKTFPKRDD